MIEEDDMIKESFHQKNWSETISYDTWEFSK